MTPDVIKLEAIKTAIAILSSTNMAFSTEELLAEAEKIYAWMTKIS